MARPTERLVTPIWLDAPRPVQEWMRQVTSILTGGSEGQDAILKAETTQAKIINGEQALTNPQISGVGSLNSILDAQNANITAATTTAGSGGALIASVSPSSAIGSENDLNTVTVTTSSVTFTASGGTSPYTCAITKKNATDPDIPPSNATPPASGAGLDEFTVTFSKSVEAFGYYSSNYCATITDNVGATFEVCVPVSVLNLGGEEF